MDMARKPERSGSTARIGLWLVFLVFGLSLPLTYLLQTPAPIGGGLLRVFGWGGLIGAVVGALIRVFCSPLFQARTWWSRGKVTVRCIFLGTLGGAGSGAWLDQWRVVHRKKWSCLSSSWRSYQLDDGRRAFKSRPSPRLIRAGRIISRQKTSKDATSEKATA